MSFLKRIFKTNQKQRRAQLLFERIKDIKSEYKSLVLIDNQIDDIFQSHREQYQQKKSHYLQLLDITYYRLQSNTIMFGDVFTELPYMEVGSVSKKAFILERLITLCDRIIEKYDEELVVELDLLELRLNSYLKPCDRYWITQNIKCIEIKEYISCLKKELQSQLSFLRSQLRYLFKTIKLSTLDLVECVRILFTFFHKPVDDEDSILIVTNSKTINLLIIRNSYEYKRISQIFNDYNKQKRYNI
mgnify:CR=1 FL=1